MKSFFLFSVLLTAITYAADTKLEIPLKGFYFNKNHKLINFKIKTLNKQLAKKGLDGIPEVAVVGENPKKFHEVIMKRIRAANTALGREMHLNIYDEFYGEGDIRELTFCYRGDIEGIPALLKKMRGNFLNYDTPLAVAAGEAQEINDKAFEHREGLKKRFQEEYETNLTEIDQWLNYDVSTGVALIMSDLGDQGDGTELYATEVPPCE